MCLDVWNLCLVSSLICYHLLMFGKSLQFKTGRKGIAAVAVWMKMTNNRNLL